MSQKLRIISLVMVVMLSASLAVLAAPAISPGVDVSDPVDGLYKITATIQDGSTVLANKQVTMMVFKQGETPYADDTGSNIIGIDQLTSDSNGIVEFPIGTDSTTPAGIYTVKIGGEDVDSPVVATTTIDIGGGTTVMVGDCTNDGNIDMADIGAILAYMNFEIDVPSTDAVAMAAYDVTGDGNIDMADIGAILAYMNFEVDSLGTKVVY